ncbi:hypothetical protein GMSM_25840 [Geomonas sp. Red276]
MFHKLNDERVSCTSIMSVMPIAKYIDLVSKVYEDKGGLPGQRAPLKTKTAITIRKRMVNDIQNGAVLPPIVLGVMVKDLDMTKILSALDVDELLNVIGKDYIDRVSVIDGMQRTTALLEAIELKPAVIDREIRVEFWVSNDINSLIYRMLVLNTGQVPWEVGRQLDTIYSPFIHKIKEDLAGKVEIFTKEDPARRRTKAGQYQSEKLVELLLLFSSRKTELDLKDKIAEDFARLDMIESTAHREFLSYFSETLKLLTELDDSVSRYQPEDELKERLNRISSGKDIFGSFPAMVGFCSAMSIYLFDEPGFPIDWPSIPGKLSVLRDKLHRLLAVINALPKEELTSFLQVELLEEKLNTKSGQVGRFERDFFKRSFLALFNNAERLQDFAPCWMAR